MSFLTVEDVNSVNLNVINEFYEINTSQISEQEFDSVLYDFSIVSHSINGNTHVFSFEIHNSLWSGGYYFTKNNGEYLDLTATFRDNHLIVTINEPSICLILYLCSFYTNKQIGKIEEIFQGDTVYVLNNDELNKEHNPLNMKDLRYNETFSYDITTVNQGVNVISDLSYPFYLLVLIKKNDLIFDLSNESATVGVINHIPINIDANFLPNGDLVGEESLDIEVQYGNTVIPVVYDSELNDYCFDLDLTDKIDNKPAKLKIMINEIDLVNSSVYDIVLPCNYSSASSYEELQSNIIAGAEIIELTNDIAFNSNLLIPNNLMIYSNNHNIYLGSFHINVPNSVSIEIDDANFFNGTNCFIQEINTKLVLKNCRFNNAIISDNYKGSVVSADYDSSYDSIITELVDCSFINCHHTIYHGGEISIKNCRALFNSFNESVDTDYPAFLTAYNGTVEITNSTFDIDYDTDFLSDNNIDIKFAEALIGLGEDTFFNGYTTNHLKYNDSLPFFESPFNNKSHIFAKYYYPQINASVISSPNLGNEDTCVCHILLGTDWIYKNNVQITRTSWKSENNIRKIEWRDV
ncbi:hypothetical protein [uncultured Methanobrevibacter sp.]|uniref:hypothetical protein n=1 Tax=uncultured Methanobrevibacter sp. TaxID=253161 RepID=UPI0025CCBD27|nr:hypothetical protein [uncultured Methanobrevibacter sp.]